MTVEKKKPVLIYDGDCNICQYWVNYWQKLTAESVDYRPYQQTAKDYPDITLEEFQRAIQFIDIDGKVSSGAEATFQVLRDTTPYQLLLILYRYLPGFAMISELAYSFFSKHRGLLRVISHSLWGKRFEPPRYELTRWLFLKALALIYLGAFISLGTQVTGLVGSDGILPLTLYLQNAREYFGGLAWLNLPTLFWLNASNTALISSCIAGVLFSIFLLFNRWTLFSLITLYVLYLSLTIAGQDFMAFQWDLLLLEVGFLAIFLGTRSSIIVWLYRWLVFRYMLMSGVVKLASHDPTWNNLTALSYHFETQPLPTPLAWYAHHLPDNVLMLMAAATLFIELLLPFLLFLPRRLRMSVGIVFIIFQVAIILTGNYNFFNLLTIAMCLFLFDDAALHWLLPTKLHQRFTMPASNTSTSLRKSIVATFVAILVLSISTTQFLRIFTQYDSAAIKQVSGLLQPLHIVNIYGPFAVMTTARMEIDIQGSNDKRNWRSYDFKYKPDDITEIPGWIIPHQPRLDWQMWFAALNKPEQNPWFRNLIFRLLQGKEDVTGLFANNPFPDKPPMYVRAVMYHYRFTEPEAHQENADWWTREATSLYFPGASLQQK